MHKLLLVLLTLILVIGVAGCDNELNDTTYTLTSEVGEGNGTLIPEEGTHEIDENATVNLEATPAEDYEFSHWDGVAEVNSAETTIMMDKDRTVTAHFVEQDESDEPIEIDGMVLVEPGTTSSDNGSVTVDNYFYIGKYHVTQAEFEDVMGFNPSYFNDEDHPNLTGNSENRPVENVTWYDSVMYCNKLSEEEGLDEYYNISDEEYFGDDAEEGEHPQSINNATVTENEEAGGYGLPTAVEHEYAMRGGEENGIATDYAGSDVIDDVGWYYDNSDEANSDYVGYAGEDKGTMPVEEKQANELGLYDMSGNVYDWTYTWIEDKPIHRGGSWYNEIQTCEVDYERTYAKSDDTGGNFDVGFRHTRNH